MATVLIIEMRHGDQSCDIYNTHEEAKDALASFCDDWWDHEFPAKTKPDDRDEMIAEYFEDGRESYFIHDNVPLPPQANEESAS